MVQEKKKKVDVVTTVALVGGVTALGVGAYLMFKKPAGAAPGDEIIASFRFDYLGDGGTYTIQLRLGSHNRIGVIDWFIAKPGLVWFKNIELPEPDTYEDELECIIPDGAPAARYDAEASIRTPDMSQDDRLIRIFKDEAVTIRED